jgi:FlaA1/EpsC-like NDP-sugar epimerase
VIGSAGSVIPIFREQIRKGGPVTVTHPEMVRYFMTIPEAAQLVLQAAAMGEGGEIFILDMGEPVRILDLARDTITLSGLRPFEDINIVFTGMRPGEKLFEELQTTEEKIIKTGHPKIFIGRIAAYPEKNVQHALERLSLLAENGWERELRLTLNHILPEARLKVTSEEFPGATKVSGSLRAVGAEN